MFFFVLIMCFQTQAQIQETAPTYNPILRNQAVLKAQAHQQKIANFKQRYAISNSRSGIDIEDNIYVVSDESKTFCKDTISDTNGGGSFDLLDCGTLNFGTVSLDSTCITYTANAGVELGIDTVCVVFCKETNDCDTIQYPIVVRRPNLCISPPTIVLEAEGTEIFCVDTDTLNLPGNFTRSKLLLENECGEYEDFGTNVTKSGLCIMYEATLAADMDMVCVIVCDDVFICDTIKIPFIVTQDTLSLPFFDDFSYDGPYPSLDNWLSRDVFVNNTIGNNPPSVGVATFDGLDETGAVNTGGVSDILTSAYIDLNGADNTFLNYFIQPKGNGDKPEAQDSLILEFKNQLNQWIEIEGYAGYPDSLDNNDILPFSYHVQFIDDPQFLYNGFQFRFRNKSSNKGAIDLWHLDYVRLDNGTPSSTFEDVAFTKVPNDILAPYAVMPWEHFEGNESNELDRFIEVSIYNASDMTANAGGSSVTISEMTSGTRLFDAELFNGQEANIPAGEFTDRMYDLDSDNGIVFPNVWNGQNYLSQMQGDFGTDKPIFVTEYELVSTENSVSSNDIVRRMTFFDDYFAYDDGTAESNIAAKVASTQVAVQFHTNIADTLRAIQMHIPHVNVDVSGQLFNLKVWIGELDDDPEYEAILQRPVYADTHFDTLQGFTTYLLRQDFTDNLTPLNIPAGDFYIGWQQVTNETDNAIPVGLDKNNPTAGEFIYSNTGGAWESASFIEGAVMLRAVFGDEDVPFNTSVDELNSAEQLNVTIYPNPTDSEISIELDTKTNEDHRLEIYNSVGQRVHADIINNSTYSWSSQSKGIFFVKIYNLASQQYTVRKVIVTK